MDESTGNLLNLCARAGSRCRWPSGVGEDDLFAAALQNRRYDGGPGLTVFQLHGDARADELRRQRGGITEVDGAPVPVVQAEGTPAGSGAPRTGGGAETVGAEAVSLSRPSPSRAILMVARTQALVLTCRWGAQAGEGIVDVGRDTDQ